MHPDSGHGQGEPLSVEVTVKDRSISVTVIPMGPSNLVVARTPTGGVLGCGALDPTALGRMGIPAARARASGGPSIADAVDLLAGVLTEVNEAAQIRGARPGMTGHEALALL